MNNPSFAEQLATSRQYFETSSQSLLALVQEISMRIPDSNEKQVLMTAVQDKLQQLEDTGTLLDDFPALAKVLFNLRRAELQVVLPDSVSVLVKATYAAFRTIKKLRGVVHDDETTNPAAVNNHLDKAACDRFLDNMCTIIIAVRELPLIQEVCGRSEEDEGAPADDAVEGYEVVQPMVESEPVPEPVERACPVVQEATLPEDTAEPEQPAETNVTVNPDRDAWWQSSVLWKTVAAGTLTVGGVLMVVVLSAKKDPTRVRVKKGPMRSFPMKKFPARR